MEQDIRELNNTIIIYIYIYIEYHMNKQENSPIFWEVSFYLDLEILLILILILILSISLILTMANTYIVLGFGLEFTICNRGG